LSQPYLPKPDKKVGTKASPLVPDNNLSTWHKYHELIIDYFKDGENFNSVIDQITNRKVALELQ
jgi:hypothetical protein